MEKRTIKLLVGAVLVLAVLAMLFTFFKSRSDFNDGSMSCANPSSSACHHGEGKPHRS